MFPQASYGDTPVVWLFAEFEVGVGVRRFFVYVAVWMDRRADGRRRRYQTDAAGVTMFTAAVIFWVAGDGRKDQGGAALPAVRATGTA